MQLRQDVPKPDAEAAQHIVHHLAGRRRRGATVYRAVRILHDRLTDTGIAEQIQDGCALFGTKQLPQLRHAIRHLGRRRWRCRAQWPRCEEHERE
jgi:hypothetical protein